MAGPLAPSPLNMAQMAETDQWRVVGCPLNALRGGEGTMEHIHGYLMAYMRGVRLKSAGKAQMPEEPWWAPFLPI